MEPRTVEYPLHTPRDSHEIRALSWNVHYGDSTKHAEDVVAALKRFDCDVLLLYELNYGIHMPERIHGLGYGGVAVEMNYRRGLVPLKGGVALFSRFPIEKYHVVETISDGLLCVRRYYVEAQLRVWDHFSLTVGMIHNTLPFEFGYRGACDALYREIRRHTKRFLFMSDLNALPSSRIVRKLESKFVHLGPSLSIPSHPTSRWVKWLTPQRRIDYAFATRDVAKMLVGGARFGESFPSDHSPLLVHLRTS